jgi:hypothetical protein
VGRSVGSGVDCDERDLVGEEEGASDGCEDGGPDGLSVG